MGDLPALRVDHAGITVESMEAAELLLFALGCEKSHEERSECGKFTWAADVLGDAESPQSRDRTVRRRRAAMIRAAVGRTDLLYRSTGATAGRVAVASVQRPSETTTS
ncbi:hypothetical protein [Natronobacterium gregoryi]|uniref:Bleomycin resistance protein n=2 Tax=Natronobacterium gregoryi TaxID=44930 RepID=L0AF61_NATGS|nr:hypothetical protein Natgr_1252 [Natronobacterium gregoryi SP2]ELY74346.1 glyoxalase/bleomycin resistance protein/dioxygenase [Natronobacterium gregoryi SP2]PLK21447.1 bleomycin resistance protein [Natronobacterium gregoryi SP2]SFI77588.1 hypothetical protein SAMN05443661_10590 [Natronobacterium gregoryi]